MTLSTQGYSIDLPDPKYPGQIYRTSDQRVRANRVAELGEVRLLVGVNWDALTAAQMGAIDAFVRETLVYSRYTCTIVDLLGKNYDRMRYISGMDTARVGKGDLWSISLRFEQARTETLPFNRNLITNPNISLNANRRSAAGWDLSQGDGATFTNVDISEDFASSALNVEDLDASAEYYPLAYEIPLYDVRYTVEGWLSRRVSRNTCSLQVHFFDSDSMFIVPPAGKNTGWAAVGQGGGNGYFLAYFTGGEANGSWKKGSATFGPGSTTYVPPSSKSFKIVVQNDNADGGATIIFRVAALSVIVRP